MDQERLETLAAAIAKSPRFLSTTNRVVNEYGIVDLARQAVYDDQDYYGVSFEEIAANHMEKDTLIGIHSNHRNYRRLWLAELSAFAPGIVLIEPQLFSSEDGYPMKGVGFLVRGETPDSFREIRIFQNLWPEITIDPWDVNIDPEPGKMLIGYNPNGLYWMHYRISETEWAINREFLDRWLPQ